MVLPVVLVVAALPIPATGSLASGSLAPGPLAVRALAARPLAARQTPRSAPSPPSPAPIAPDTFPDPLATLDVWAEDVWLDLLDREGTLRGPLAGEGIFQRFHPRMDAEYELDLHTGMFTPAEDAAWAAREEGLRAAAASLSHPRVLARVDWRQAFGISRGLALTADYRRDHSLTDERDHVRLGVRWRGPGREGAPGDWTVWSAVGVHAFKPAADLEVGVARSWTAGGPGGWRVELVAAALDAFNDAVFVALGVDPGEVEVHVDHDRPPLAGRVRLEGRGRSWRVEVHGGASTPRRAHVTFPGSADTPYHLRERVSFAGALVEVAPSPGLSVAGWVRTADAVTRRSFTRGGAAHLRVRERTDAAGALLRRRLTGTLAAEGELLVRWRPETRQDPAGVTEHRDREVFGSVGVAHRPGDGWTGRAAWTVLDREAGALLPHVAGRNHRLVTEGGYRTVAGFSVTVGLRWDLDRSGRRLFDGAQLRLAASPP